MEGGKRQWRREVVGEEVRVRGGGGMGRGGEKE